MKKFILPSTCYKMGFIACAFGVLAGALSIMSLGPAALLKAVQFALYGGMLLFLASSERGKEKKKPRIKISLIFLMLLISYLNLPLLCPLLEMLVIPALYLLYRKKYGLKLNWFFAALAGELAFALVKTLQYTSVFGSRQYIFEGAFLVAVSIIRFFTLYVMYKKLLDYMLQNPREYHQDTANPLRK